LNQEIKISRSDLIAKCEQYLNGKIGKEDLENYAWQLISEDSFDWDDEVISDIVFQWDNQEINFPINETNIRLWKHQLETDENLLADYNQWNVHIDRQKEICKKFQSLKLMCFFKTKYWLCQYKKSSSTIKIETSS
jgi:hypothetical protein